MEIISKRIAFLILMMISATGQAALYDRGGGMIYDSDQNITWLQNARICRVGAGPGCEAAGIFGPGYGTLAQAKTVVDSLSWGGYDDWRLPHFSALDNIESNTPCNGYVGFPGVGVGTGCGGGEMGHLVHEYGIQGGPGIEHADAGPFVRFASIPGPFENLVVGVFNSDFDFFTKQGYWTDWADTSINGDNALGYEFYDGKQVLRGTASFLYFMAVRDGDVAAPIPEPETYAMLLAGLGLLGLTARRRRQKLNA